MENDTIGETIGEPDERTTLPDPIADEGVMPVAAVVEPVGALLCAGCMVVAENGLMLILRRVDTGQWAFPGGKVEDGEGPAETALRELLEETGLAVEAHQGLLVRRIADGVDFTTFAVRVPEPFIPVMNEEHTGFAWVRPDEVV